MHGSLGHSGVTASVQPGATLPTLLVPGLSEDWAVYGWSDGKNERYQGVEIRREEEPPRYDETGNYSNPYAAAATLRSNSDSYAVTATPKLLFVSRSQEAPSTGASVVGHRMPTTIRRQLFAEGACRSRR